MRSGGRDSRALPVAYAAARERRVVWDGTVDAT